MAQKVVEDADSNKKFPELSIEEVLPAASMDLQLDYAFHKLGKTVETWMVDQKLECRDIWA